MWLLAIAAADAVEIRTGIGMPDLLHVQVELPLTETWSVDLTAGTNLGLLTYFGAGGGARWHPLIRERGPRRLAFGVGPDLWMGPTNETLAIILAGSVELVWSYDFGPVGLLVASRIGVGPTLEVPWDRFRLEPATPLAPLQVGVFF